MKIYTEFHFPGQEPGHLIWPDSCWLLSDRPLYIPDFAPEFAAVPCLAVRTGRLGKNVAPRFASRYVAGWTAALVILPSRAVSLLRSGVAPDPMEYCFDHSVVIGEWRQPSGDIPELDMEIGGSADLPATLRLTPDQASPHEAICSLSRYNTLKMGDVILSPLCCEPVPLRERLTLTISCPADTTKTEKPHILFTRFR